MTVITTPPATQKSTWMPTIRAIHLCSCIDQRSMAYSFRKGARQDAGSRPRPQWQRPPPREKTMKPGLRNLLVTVVLAILAAGGGAWLSARYVVSRNAAGPSLHDMVHRD